MKRIIQIFLFVLLAKVLQSQPTNIGIGISNPTRAKFEVWGAAGIGTTSGLFGGEHGISIQRNYPAIGFNQYVDNANIGRYMATGFALLWQYVHNDATLQQGLSLNMYPSGPGNAALPAPTRVWNFTSNNRFQILSTGVGGGAILDVGRGTGSDGAAMFQGTAFSSHFSYGANEHTYIRGGKSTSDLYINDITNGKVIFGNGAATVGLNTNYYIPPTTLEVRQSNGGMELTNASNTGLPWEWRVATGSSPTFNLYYAGVLKNYFSPTTGALAVSDERVKTNIQNLAPVMDRIMQLEPVTYMMKDAVEGQRRSMGFIAQQVAPLFPQLVSHSMPGSIELMGLNYTGFNVIAIKGIQEEQVKIEQLDAEISAVEKRMMAIEKKLALIKH
jgi:Chaperone of endosialidase